MPKIEWKEGPWNERDRSLYLSGKRTPYWVHKNMRGDIGYPSPYTLWGAGMGALTSAGYRIAGCMGIFERISQAKAEAIKLCQQPV